jgi:hypothetical protein
MHRTLPLPLMALLAIALLGADAAAQTTQMVYRCGPGGREYSHKPCTTGREVTVADPRNEDQQRAAADVAASQTRLAKQLEAERHAREAANAGKGPAAIKPAPVVAAAASSAHPHGDKGKKKKKSKKDVDPRVTWKAKAPKKQ